MQSEMTRALLNTQTTLQAVERALNSQERRLKERGGSGGPETIEFEGQTVNLREATRNQSATQQNEQQERDVRVFESLGMPKAAAVAAARGREV
jgi:hypothetical protein